MSVNEDTSRARAYAFGPYLLDLKRRVLWRDRAPIPLKSRTLDVLAVLIEHRGRVLEKDELIRLVWRDSIVQENNLAQQISVVRRALDQRPDQHEYIVTSPGRGYHFVADVREIPCPPDSWLNGLDATAAPAQTLLPDPADEPVSSATGLPVVPDRILDTPVPPDRLRLPFWMGATAVAVVSVVLAGLRASPRPSGDLDSARSAPIHLRIRAASRADLVA